MPLQQDGPAAPGPPADPHAVAIFVDMTVLQPLGAEQLQKPGSLFLLVKSGRRDQGQLHLPLHDLPLVLLHKAKGLADPGAGRESVESGLDPLGNLIGHWSFLLNFTAVTPLFPV